MTHHPKSLLHRTSPPAADAARGRHARSPLRRRVLAAALALGTIGAVGVGQVPAEAATWTTPASVEPVEAGSYVVTMRDAPAARYQGGVDGFVRTQAEEGTHLDTRSPAVTDYRTHLQDEHRDAATRAGAEITQDYGLTVNAFSARLDAAQVRKLRGDHRVLRVEKDVVLHPQSTPHTRFLGLEGSDGVWAKTGGQASAGEGVVLGDLDTGISPDSPSFAGAPLGTTAGAEPYRDGKATVFRKADGRAFHGACQTGPGFAASDCTSKVISARYFAAGQRAAGNDLKGPGEFASPRDGDEHGTHTASTAAGDAGVVASVAGRVVDTISGVAPAARIAAYKVCWGASKDGHGGACEGQDIIAAIEQATTDGVDVINYSLGGTPSGSLNALDLAQMGAASAGVFISAAAGNAGPDASSLDNDAPWVTTVGASTVPDDYPAMVRLGDARVIVGGSLTVVKPVSGPLVSGRAASAPGAVDPSLCGPGTLDPQRVTGRIVLCERGGSARTAKSAEVERAGGIGMILMNVTPNSMDLDDHPIPTVHVDADSRDALLAYAGTAGATATLSPGNTTGSHVPAPQIAGFSSRGPSEVGDGDVLKPDVAAPGVGILAASANGVGQAPRFAALSGTSMATPNVAGLGLLYLSKHPQASPAEIKSALMTTATDTVDAAGKPDADPFAQGAGEVDAPRFLDPGLLYLNGADDWKRYVAGTGADANDGSTPSSPSELNLASIGVGRLVGTRTITRTVTSTRAGSYTAVVTGLPGVTATIVPSTISFTAPGQTRSFEVRLTARPEAEDDTWSTGSLTWDSPEGTVRSPIAVRPRVILGPDSVTGHGTTGKVTYPVTLGGAGRLPVTTLGLAEAQVVKDPHDPASSSTGSGATGSDSTYPLQVTDGDRGMIVTTSSPDADAGADVDLTLEHLGADGKPDIVWTSEGPSTEDGVGIAHPPVGAYLAHVTVFSLTKGRSTASFTLRHYHLRSDGGIGRFTVAPAAVEGAPGARVDVTASWEGLKADSSYRGLVEYAGATTPTLVGVETGAARTSAEAPRAITSARVEGEPVVGSTLHVDPGTWTGEALTYTWQWRIDGRDVAGATGPTYVVPQRAVGRKVDVVITATASGGGKGESYSPYVNILDTAKVTVGNVTPPAAPAGTVTVRVSVASSAAGSPTGQVTVSLDGTAHEATLDGAGTATVTITGLAKGSHSLSAAYAGDATTAPGTVPARSVRVR